jgi:RNA polymerase sigma factor (sigma-70 family)
MPMTTANTSYYAPTAATPSVADLLLRIGDKDPAAWDEIVRRYGKLLSATVRSFRLQDADALDAVQMTWLGLTEHAQQIQDPVRLGGWLATTARRECLHVLRQAKPTPDHCDAVPDTIADPLASPEQRVIDADTTRTLWSFVGELSPRRRNLLRDCSPIIPAPTPRSPASPESLPAGLDPPGREPWRSFGTGSNNTGSGGETGDDDHCYPADPGC